MIAYDKGWGNDAMRIVCTKYRCVTLAPVFLPSVSLLRLFWFCLSHSVFTWAFTHGNVREKWLKRKFYINQLNTFSEKKWEVWLWRTQELYRLNEYPLTNYQWTSFSHADLLSFVNLVKQDRPTPSVYLTRSNGQPSLEPKSFLK